jgi:hypothetical protein
MYANFPSSPTGSYASVDPVVKVVPIPIYGAVFVHNPVAPPAISRISRATVAPPRKLNIFE